MSTVVQVVQHLKPGGIETMALDLSAFCESDEMTLIVSLEGDLKTALRNWPRLQSISDKLIFLGKAPGLNLLLIIRLMRLFKRLKVNVVHTHHIGPLLYAGIAARLAGVDCLIHTEHDAWHLTNARRRNLQRWVIRMTHPLLVADAQSVATSMQHYLKLKNLRIIRNGIDTERFTPGDRTRARQILCLPQKVQLIGCSGRLEIVKGQEILIHALADLPPNAHLALAGTGSTEIMLRQLSKSLNLSDRVHFLGHVDEMPVFYQALDIFCLPSLNEGLPLSPLEAQACNIPAAVTDVGGASETLCPYSGALIPPENAAAMASTLRNMLVPKERNLQPCPRDFVRKQGDIHHMARSYSRLRIIRA